MFPVKTIKRILILGKDPGNVQPAAAALGYEVEWQATAESRPDAPSSPWEERIASGDLHGILAAAPCALTRVAQAASRHQMPGPAIAAAGYLSNRRALRDRLDACGISQVDYACARSPEGAVEAALGMEPPFYVVPAEGGSARESVTEFPDDLVLASKRAARDAPSSEVVIESHARSARYSLIGSVYEADFLITAIIGQHSAKRPFRFPAGLYCPANVDARLDEALRALARETVRALDIDFGQVRIDLLMSQGEMFVLEVDQLPAWTWMPVDLIELAGGPSCTKNVLRMATGGAPLAHDLQRAAALAWIPTHTGKIVSIDGLKEAASIDGIAEIQLNVRVGDTMRHVLDPAGRDRVGYIAAKGPDIETALARVERALECCHIETSTTY